MWPLRKTSDKLEYPPVFFFLDIRNRLPRKGINKLKVLNVGVGSGDSGIANQMPYLPFKRLDHIDIYEPYLKSASVITWAAKKVRFIEADIRNFDTSIYDYVFMFDILEHLPKEDSLKVIKNIKCHQIIFIPLENEFRENTFGVKSQDHLSFWTESDFLERGYKTELLPTFHREDKYIFDALWAIK